MTTSSAEQVGIRADVLTHMDDIANHTKADVFLLHPKQVDADTASIHGTLDVNIENRLRVFIYGDMESCEYAKTRLLIMIDQIVCITQEKTRVNLLTQ